MRLLSLWIYLICLKLCQSVNTRSIRLATEYQVKRARDRIEDNYESIIQSGEHYAACATYDMCTDPLTLVTDSSREIDDWNTYGTAWHSPQCNASETIIGVRSNNHDTETGELLTDDTCPEYSEYFCNYDNSLKYTAVKYPGDTDTSSQEFWDATCFTSDLEEIWTTRIYSNCHEDYECYEYTSNGTKTNNATCLDYGICSNTPEPNIYDFTPSYVGYQYYGDQRTGLISQIPALYWGACPGSYDPRFRPWYATTVSGPKDLILIVDTSGSMSQGNPTRLSVMQEAAIAALDTLTEYDYATVIAFSADAESASTHLLPMTDTNRCELENYISSLSASGLTNYEDAFKLGYDTMYDSFVDSQISGCDAQVILFLTDGAITEGRSDIVDMIDEYKNNALYEGIDFKILTYAIGDDLESSDLSKLQDISCSNEGIYYEIADLDELSNTMASYYTLFVSLREETSDDDEWVVWIDYIDILAGYRLMAASLPVYDKTTDPWTLLGVVVSDVAAERLIDSNKSEWGNDVGLYSDFDDEWDDMLNTAKTCPTLNFDENQLETIRSAVSSSATCNTNSNNSSSTDTTIIIIVVAVFIVSLVMVGIGMYTYNRSKKEGKKLEGERASNFNFH